MTRYVTAVLMACGAAAAEPAWTVAVPAGIEWSAVVGGGDTAAILLATPEGELHIIDLATGRARLDKPIAAGRGVRAAAGLERDGVAYCFDRHAAYAIELAPARLKWQYGQNVGRDEELRGDPENIAGWAHAAVSSAGLLLVNSDGRVVLLSYADGRARWDLSVGRMPMSRLHVRDDRAVVIWKSEGTVRAAFLALDQQLPKPRYCDVGQVWPVWSELLSEGLLTVAGRELTLTADRRSS